MISVWMVYCLLLAALCALAALAVEPVLLTRRLPTRWVWGAALLLSVTLPAALALVPRGAAPAPDPGHTVVTPAADWTRSNTPAAPLPAWIAMESAPVAARAGAAVAARSADLERALAWAWLSSSLLLLGGALVGYLLLRLRGRRWPEIDIDGVPVLISGSVGPAVLGFIRTRIVLPRWALEADPDRRRLILEHERQHVAAHDPLLLMLGLAAVIAAPWNVALWWQLRRLRLAIEIDCDSRVLAGNPARARAYGALLLELGRSASAGPLPIAAFSEPTSTLERRIRAMTTPIGVARRRLVLPLVAVGLAATSAAALPLPPSLLSADPASVPRPDVAAAAAPQPQRSPSSIADAVPVADDLQPVRSARSDTLPARFRSAQLRELVEREYPPALREAEVEGYATVGFTVGADGRASGVEPVIADRPEFARAAERLVTQLAFTPATVAGAPVPERVDRFRVHFGLGEEAPVPDIMGIDPLLRSALENLYPELAAGDPVRVPYVFLVVDTLGQPVVSALDYEPPTIAREVDAIRARFPQLRDREFGTWGRRSVRLEPEARQVEVFYAEIDPPADEMDIVRRGPYPLGAMIRARTITRGVMQAAVENRHPEVRERGLPREETVWVVGTRTGEIRASGTGPKKGVREVMERHLSGGEPRFASIGFLEARNGTRYEVRWALIDRP